MLDLERFVNDCRAAIAGPSPEPAIKEILARAVSRPGEVEAALGTPRQGEVATLYHGRDLTILNVVWTPGIEVPPQASRSARVHRRGLPGSRRPSQGEGAPGRPGQAVLLAVRGVFGPEAGRQGLRG